MPDTVKAWNISNVSAPPIDWIPITPADGVDVSVTAENGNTIVGVRALRANTAGNIVVVMASGQTRTLPFLAGETRVGLFQRVKETSTTATGIEGAV